MADAQESKDLSRLIKLLRLALRNPSPEEGQVALHAAHRAARGTQVEALLDRAKGAADPESLIEEALGRLGGTEEEDWSWLEDLYADVAQQPPQAPPPPVRPPWSAAGWKETTHFQSTVWESPNGMRVKGAVSGTGWQWVKGEVCSKFYADREEAMFKADEWWSLLTRGAPFDLYTPKPTRWGC